VTTSLMMVTKGHSVDVLNRSEEHRPGNWLSASAGLANSYSCRYMIFQSRRIE